MRLVSLLYFWVSWVLAAIAQDLPGRPLVDLGYSKYQGVRLAAGVDQFLGMRFAAPSLGDFRFRAPRDAIRHRAVQDASKFGPVCIGADQNITVSQAEDCLFINVFAPSGSKKTSRLPVWVYIQGGGYTSNANAKYNGAGVVQESDGNIILVNFNYRVGALDGDHNVGLLDQRKSLPWVQRHIHKFGGDPDYVVIHGASAGASSVALYLAAYVVRDDGLFRTLGESNVYLDRLLNRVGCYTISCLRSPDSSAIEALVWVPVIDGTLVQRLLYTAFEDGRFIRVPLMAINEAYPQLPQLHITRNAPRRDLTDTWDYRYNVQGPTSLALGYGVPHTVETSAIFGLDYGGGIGFSSLVDANAPIIPIMMNFTSFVRGLNPNTLKHATAPVWQPWEAAHQRLKIQTNDTVMEGVPRDQQARCAISKKLAPITKQ
ncbi:Alpha/Beta hydrolase protein [Aspergillus pseudodeflectus]|uniref:Carboxylic ester hydrolase n=1 Tax=Aspergillus pseudodeflectus TaxID=176178 RepID=A0ABR4JHT6_9EURO